MAPVVQQKNFAIEVTGQITVTFKNIPRRLDNNVHGEMIVIVSPQGQFGTRLFDSCKQHVSAVAESGSRTLPPGRYSVWAEYKNSGRDTGSEDWKAAPSSSFNEDDAVVVSVFAGGNNDEAIFTCAKAKS